MAENLAVSRLVARYQQQLEEGRSRVSGEGEEAGTGPECQVDNVWGSAKNGWLGMIVFRYWK